MRGEGKELIIALNQIVKETGIDIDLIFEAIESSLVFACKKNYGSNYDFKILMDRKTGEINCFVKKIVSLEVEDPNAQISLEEAKEIKMIYQIGDVIDIPIKPKDFGRIAAQTAKQVIVQKIREAERDITFNEYIQKEKEVITAIVERKEKNSVILSLGKNEAYLSAEGQMPNEEYIFSKRVKVYVTEVRQSSKGVIINVSRTHPGLVLKLFEQEVPEIQDGIVEIKNISREAGTRSKIAVMSNDIDIDPVGACVGPAGSRVNIIVNELKGERIDIINWSEDPKNFITSALNPSKVLDVIIDQDTKTAKVTVPKHQLSLAIGKDGQNARLAAKLTGYRIDIKSYDDSQNDKIYEDFYKDFENFYKDEYSNNSENETYNMEDFYMGKESNREIQKLEYNYSKSSEYVKQVDKESDLENEDLENAYKNAYADFSTDDYNLDENKEIEIINKEDTTTKNIKTEKPNKTKKEFNKQETYQLEDIENEYDDYEEYPGDDFLETDINLAYEDIDLDSIDVENIDRSIDEYDDFNNYNDSYIDYRYIEDDDLNFR
ncbi:MAG: transcription termination factor NusA [Defluviitaleaceae bacterium]|nr:transcription termination factor NusA [Defluviitaleaceae bacterium]